MGVHREPRALGEWRDFDQVIDESSFVDAEVVHLKQSEDVGDQGVREEGLRGLHLQPIFIGKKG